MMTKAGFALITCVCFAAPFAQAEALRVLQDGVERVIWVEDGRADRSLTAPLVLALHGYTRPESAAEKATVPETLAWPDLRRLAARDGAVVLFPAAYKGQWALFDGLPNTTTPDGTAIDDEAFLLALIERFTDTGIADPNRIYITGISDGAIMTYRMICLSDTPFAAAAPLIGSAYGGHLETCTPNPPPALMHVHGTDDRVLPYEGWIFASGREVSVPEVMEHWRQLHGCTGQEGQMLENIDPDDGSRVGEMTWTGCTRNGTVTRYKVIGGGHDVPDVDAVQPGPDAQRINRDLDTMTVMWAFFQTHLRP
ncbi:MAG: hypothetical protein AAFY25_11240 [Pseudomonadota bacterium]